ncbi:hypothetical protein, variant [Phytophthora nicotianae CJ01A1]|uniref:DUF1640 domain-containing protein n=6 Tax=Phytophthora nicotianae TaxID=4792 RepID=W2RCI8_PHYN3|nr:hypothetical protein, variant [Phytophthora nicotianae INRA-310]ETI50186.1 hypothetical protein, variant [Phytophthora nicotianae P1569]ETK90069.1 hypothetical protein, variant [Phytophthora nicotianae]ETO78909.1 hypothetical protein, variant [Phytophthora nicotianae P1976]ETP19950.1 hypothetical protein, variant [Phytophthora nicotianae CJ01A1]ETP47893.1 hypothetical protein, variant [Phytophthora nicotianae P10297]KUF78457.1 hypothetical protein AM587_10007003 [Phytophthora nicotianae]
MIARAGIAVASVPRAQVLAALPQHFQSLVASQTLAKHNSVKASLGSIRSTHPAACSAIQVVPAGRRCFTTDSSDTPLHFDTHNVVKSLQDKGFSPDQSEAILQVMKDAMADSLEAQSRILATKSEHVELKAELSERVFNSTLKFDIAQRHSRELLERDFNTLKQDIRMLEKIDFDKIRMEIAELEKKFLLQKQAEDETLNELRLSMEKVEKRMLQYAVGFAGTIMAVGAALLRLVL